jgi:hypothetical protein
VRKYKPELKARLAAGAAAAPAPKARVRCEGKTAKGSPCKRVVSSGSRYCCKHEPAAADQALAAAPIEQPALEGAAGAADQALAAAPIEQPALEGAAGSADGALFDDYKQVLHAIATKPGAAEALAARVERPAPD